MFVQKSKFSLHENKQFRGDKFKIETKNRPSLLKQKMFLLFGQKRKTKGEFRQKYFGMSRLDSGFFYDHFLNDPFWLRMWVSEPICKADSSKWIETVSHELVTQLLSDNTDRSYRVERFCSICYKFEKPTLCDSPGPWKKITKLGSNIVLKNIYITSVV